MALETTRKLIKHDRYVEQLQRQLETEYDHISTNIHLISKKTRRKVAEIDIMAERDGIIDIFEVKCSYRRVKAKKQLTKIKKLMPEVNKGYFFCGESGLLEDLV